MKLVLDMSSILWRALLVGKDTEFGYEIPDPEKPGKQVWVNSAQHGYECAVNMLTRMMEETGAKPIDTIMVFEGMRSKAMRLRIDPEYKANRGQRPKEINIEFNKLINMIEREWLDMGAITARQEMVEADDVIAFLAENLEEDVVVCSYDGDMTVLNGVNQYGANVQVWIDGVVGENKYGPFDTKFVTVYKALIGDSSDGIKGVKGFGPAKWEEFVRKYGDEGLQDMIDLFTTNRLEELADHAGTCKLCAMISDQREQAQRCWDLAKMHPEWVNAFKIGKIEWKAGMVKQLEDNTDERLRKYRGKARLVHAGNYDAAMKWAMPLIRASKEVSLDIETSTPEESDDWLAAKAQRDKDADKVDVFGSELVSMGLTFGDNNQYTLYFTTRHLEEEGVPNLTSDQIRNAVESIPQSIPIVIQNLAFELTVLHQEWGAEMADNGYHGFLPNCLDTKIEASYVDENRPLGLKQRSKSILGYDQTSYQETTTKEGPVGTLPQGGKLLATFDVTNTIKEPVYAAGFEDQPGEMLEPGEFEVVPHERRQYKMHELTASEVFDYGTDDTICTIALHSYYKVVMQIEHTWEVYKQVEIAPAYLTALAYVQGTPMSLEKMRELERGDDEVYDKSWAVVREFLIKAGWDGSVPPAYGVDITPAQVKEAFAIVFDRPLDTMMRKIDKLVAFIKAEEGGETFATMLAGVTDEAGAQRFTDYVRVHFKGEPDFNTGSPKQLQKFMYETMGLPIRLFNKPTDKMRQEGKKQGTPKTDDLAIQYALKYDAPEKPEIEPVLDAFRLMKMVQTRRGLYYKPYAVAAHWKDGLLHPNHNQCATNTRRYSASDPNDQQLPKHPKATGEPARFREVYVPHKRRAVVVSLDFNSQELRVIADYSQDANMLACYVGDNLKDMHSLTALGIVRRREADKADWSYETFICALQDGPLKSEMKTYRALGKKTNFTTEYGAMAPKLAQTLLVSEEEAQSYIDAKLEAFPDVQPWKDSVIEEARAKGFVTTMMGARRHLAEALESDDGYERSKADRQGVNFKVQGSSAEMTKMAMGRMWKAGIPFKYDCRFIAPIHDEVVWSVDIDQLLPFLKDVHACMVASYANMKVPIVSSISFGPSFGEQIEIGEEPTAEAVEAGLVEYRKMVGEAVAA